MLEGLRLLKKLDVRETPLAKSVAMLVAMSMLEVVHRRNLGRSVNLN